MHSCEHTCTYTHTAETSEAQPGALRPSLIQTQKVGILESTQPYPVYAVSSSSAVHQKPARENTRFSPKIFGIPYQVISPNKQNNKPI